MKRNSTSFFFPIVLGIVAALLFVYANSTPPPVAETPVAVIATVTVAPPEATPAAVSTAVPHVRAMMSLPNAGVVAPIIDVFIRDGSWDVANLGAAVGHLQGTAPIGTPNNVGLAGHSELRDGTRGIFAYIQELNYGDPILIEMGDQQFEYRVNGLRSVQPTDLSVLRPTDHERLTLITCDDYDFLLNIYKTRVVVLAERVS
jgi:sortase A